MRPHTRWVLQMGALALVAGLGVAWMLLGLGTVLDSLVSLPSVLAWLVVVIVPAAAVVVVITLLELGDELLAARQRRRSARLRVELVEGRPRVGEVRVRPSESEMRRDVGGFRR